DIPRRRSGAANRIAGRIAEVDAVFQIGQSRGAVNIGTDEVSLYQVSRERVSDKDAVTTVGGDDVSRAGGGAADCCALIGCRLHTTAGIAQSGGAGDVGADEIAL